MADVYEKLPGALLPWYEANRRDLPWRRDREPYHVWLSEIMLQQTRVEAVKGYYLRFLDALPSIPDLADADPDALHKLWEGLGYYSRVRNLQKAARVIVEQYGGVFPSDHAAIRALPGIGDYTAGAVASICFGQPTPAVDGNVLRVTSRVDACYDPITDPKVKKAVGARLAAVYPAGRCGDFTQSLMELGATVCVPNGAPHCEVCPCRDFCRARALGCQTELPVKAAKKERRVEEKTVFLLRCGERVALEWSMADDIDLTETMVPSFIVQPLVENAFKHGIIPRETGGAVRILIRRLPRYQLLYIAVLDNGVGMAPDALHAVRDRLREVPESGEHIGLCNVAARLRLLDPPGALRVYAAPDKGTRAVLFLPLIEPGEEEHDDV